MSKKNRGIGTIALAYFRQDMDRRDAINYWRGDHGWLVSQQDGCSVYRQVKFMDDPLLHIPGWKVDERLNKQFIPDGAAENLVPTYVRGIKLMLSDNRKKIYLDERNFLRQVFMYVTCKSNCIWFKDDLSAFDNETGIESGERILLLFKGDGLKGLVLHTLPNIAMKNEAIKEIHSYCFTKYREKLWASVDVNHIQPKSEEYQAALLLGADNKAAVLDFLRSAIVAAAIDESSAESVYALDVEQVTVMRYNDKRSLKAINGKSGNQD